MARLIRAALPEVMDAPHIRTARASGLFDPRVQTIWLTLWGEIATSPALGDGHRRLYASYRADVAAALREAAGGRQIDAEGLATGFICLTDGFGVPRCVEPSFLSEDAVRAACRALPGPHLGWP